MSAEPFVRLTGVAAPLMRPNIDTDQITPGHTGMKVAKEEFGQGLFHHWRFRPDGSEDPGFVLNQAPFRQARFLVAGDNFGCGSSREFAVWALRDFGIRAVVAPGFGAIFTSNCFVNGVLPIVLDGAAVVSVAAEIVPGRECMTVDLEREVVVSPAGHEHRFHIPAVQRERLLEGLDAIEATRKRDAQIAAFQVRDAGRRPWLYRPGARR